MERYHSKRIDPTEFKHNNIDNLQEQVEQRRERARKYKSNTDSSVDTCPICGCEERESVLSMYGIDWMQCQNCSHVYQPKILSQEALIDFYASDEDYASTYIDEEQMEYRLENITKPKFDFVLDKVDVEQGRWLDVGCGNGGSVHYLESLNWKPTGLEISEHSVRAAANHFGVDLHQQTLEEYHENNPEAEFDVVSMFGYLGLVQDPQSDLQLASELLGDKGYIAVHVARYDSVSLRIQQTFRDQATRVLGWNLLHIFTEESLREAFDQTGFEIRAAWYYGLDFYEMITNLSMSIDGFVNSDLYDYFSTHLNEFQEIIDRSEMSDYFTVIAEKT